MGSCVSKKAARAGAGAKVAAPLLPEKDNALPPPVVVVEEEVKEVLSETAVQRPRPPEPEPEPEQKVKRIQEHEEGEASDTVSVGSSSVVDKPMVKSGSEQEVEKRTVDVPEKEKAKMKKAPDQRNPNDVTHGRARSPSPASKQRRQPVVASGEQPVAARPRREQPAVVSGIGCRSGRFSPSAARRAAESAVRRTYSAREADMTLPSSTAKRSLNASITGVRRDPGERSGRRPDSPARRTPSSPAANGTISRQSSATRKVPKENTSPEQTKRQCSRARPTEEIGLGDELDEAPLAGKEHKEAAENPSVAMECFIFL
ncbi:hypothetical protein ACQ4PT_001978 [Festuca glaucescens]